MEIEAGPIRVETKLDTSGNCSGEQIGEQAENQKANWVDTKSKQVETERKLKPKVERRL